MKEDLILFFKKKSIYDDGRLQIKPGPIWSRLKIY